MSTRALGPPPRRAVRPGGAAADDGLARAAMRSGAARGTEQHEYALPPAGGRGCASSARRSSMCAARSTACSSCLERLDPMREAETSLSGAARGSGAGRRAGPRGRHRRHAARRQRDGAARRWGSAARTSAGASLAQIDCELADGELARMVERLRANGAERRETSYASRRRPGTLLPVEVIAQRAGRGRRESILLLARDIGERKRAELALLESAERFRSLFDESPVGPAAARREPARAAVQPRASRLLDRALIDLVGAEWRRCSMRRTPGRGAAAPRPAGRGALRRGRCDVRLVAGGRPRRLDAAGRPRLAGRAKPALPAGAGRPHRAQAGGDAAAGRRRAAAHPAGDDVGGGGAGTRRPGGRRQRRVRRLFRLRRTGARRLAAAAI